MLLIPLCPKLGLMISIFFKDNFLPVFKRGYVRLKQVPHLNFMVCTTGLCKQVGLGSNFGS